MSKGEEIYRELESGALAGEKFIIARIDAALAEARAGEPALAAMCGPAICA